MIVLICVNLFNLRINFRIEGRDLKRRSGDEISADFVSQSNRLLNRSAVADVAGVEGAGRFEEEDLDFACRHGSVFDAARDDEKLAGLQLDVAITKLHFKTAGDHKEKLILGFVSMPDELAVELDQLDLLTVQFTHDPGIPMIRKCGEFLGKIHFVQGGNPFISSASGRLFPARF